MNTNTESPVSLALKSLDEGVETLIRSEGWEAYLKAQAKFHNYSFNNTIWLTIQGSQRAVDVSRFAGFQTWKSLGRQVVAGAKSFKVLAPISYKKEVKNADGSTETKNGCGGFRVVSVFDISQTDGEPLAEVCQNLEGESSLANETFTKLAAWSAARGVTVTREHASGANGYYIRSEARIVVDDKLEGTQALKTLAHEVAHSLLHSTDEGDTRETKEVEAESTAFVVLSALGIDASGYSFGYIASWSRGSKVTVKAVAGRVQKAAHQILEALA